MANYEPSVDTEDSLLHYHSSASESEEDEEETQVTNISAISGGSSTSQPENPLEIISKEELLKLLISSKVPEQMRGMMCVTQDNFAVDAIEPMTTVLARAIKEKDTDALHHIKQALQRVAKNDKLGNQKRILLLNQNFASLIITMLEEVSLRTLGLQMCWALLRKSHGASFMKRVSEIATHATKTLCSSTDEVELECTLGILKEIVREVDEVKKIISSDTTLLVVLAQILNHASYNNLIKGQAAQLMCELANNNGIAEEVHIDFVPEITQQVLRQNGVIQTLISSLDSEDRVYLSAITSALNALSKDKQGTEEIRSGGAVKGLLRKLSATSPSRVRKNSAQLIRQMVVNSRRETEEEIKANKGFKPVLELLDSTNTRVIYSGLQTMEAIAAKSEESQREFGEAGAIEKVVKLLDTGPKRDVEFFIQVVRTLNSLIEYNEYNTNTCKQSQVAAKLQYLREKFNNKTLKQHTESALELLGEEMKHTNWFMKLLGFGSKSQNQKEVDEESQKKDLEKWEKLQAKEQEKFRKAREQEQKKLDKGK